MVLKNALQPGYNTSLMGVLHGAAAYYGLDLSAAAVFGGTGHAFVMNVHKELCPSSPYVWDQAPLRRLATNIGLEVTELGFYDSSTLLEHRLQIEASVRELLDRGVICALINLDNQLITGYEEARLLLAEPWGEMPMTPPTLSSETWAEFGDELHVTFYRIEPTERVDERTTAVQAVEFALELYEHPRRYAEPDYGMGPDAYENWIAAVRAGRGADHGAWWNAMVWSECRGEAASYLRILAEHLPLESETARGALRGAAEQYNRVALELRRVADRELPAEQKAGALETARDDEAAVMEAMPELIGLVRG